MNYVYQVTVFTDAEVYQELLGVVEEAKFSHAPQAFAYEAGFNAALELMAGQLPHKYWTRVTQEEGK